MTVRNKHLSIIIILAIVVLFLSLLINYTRGQNLTQKRPMVINFTAKWCSECQVMKKYVWSHWRIGRELEYHYLYSQRIDMDVDDERNKKWVKKYKIKEIPVILIVDSDNKEKGRKIGYQNVNNLLTFLRKHR
jgi:thiol:disulfide interchange protein DsbD